MQTISGTHYNQSDRLDRDQAADFTAALATANPLMHLHGLGYDVSSAKVVGDPEPRRPHPNRNYRIGTEVLPTGKVRAKAHGRKTNTQTFSVGTPPEAAALALAAKIEGERIQGVRLHSSDGGLRADWDVYVMGGA